MNVTRKLACTISGSPIESFPFGLDEQDDRCVSIKKQLKKNILYYIRQGIKVFYINSEIGVPLWAAEILINFKKKYQIMINLAVPFEEQAVKWTPEWRNRYFKVHESSDNIKILGSYYTKESYMHADTFMVDNSDCLVYFGNDIDPFIYQYARRKGLAINHVRL